MKYMNGLDILLLFLIITAMLLALRRIRSDRRKGKGCLSCGGSCGGCGLNCSSRTEEKKP